MASPGGGEEADGAPAGWEMTRKMRWRLRCPGRFILFSALLIWREAKRRNLSEMKGKTKSDKNESQASVLKIHIWSSLHFTTGLGQNYGSRDIVSPLGMKPPPGCERLQLEFQNHAPQRTFGRHIFKVLIFCPQLLPKEYRTKGRATQRPHRHESAAETNH